MSACQEIRLQPDANHLYELFVSYVRHYPVLVLFKKRIFPWINDLCESIMISGVVFCMSALKDQLAVIQD